MKHERLVLMLAMCQAAQSHRQGDGTYPRAWIRAFAEANQVGLSTLLRWLSRWNATHEDPNGGHASLYAVEERAGVNHDRMIHALNVTTSKYRAWMYAREQWKYPLSYRTFMRDVDRLHPDQVAYALGGYEALVRSRLYGTNVIPHKHHTWFLDSTMSDVRVLPDRGKQLFRPWITMIVDGSSGVILTVVVFESNPTTEQIAAAIASAATGGDRTDPNAPYTGGLPVAITFDNGAENMGEAIKEGCMRFGIVVAPTHPYSPWQNGRAERSHRTLQQQKLAQLPGYIKGGVLKNGDPRFEPPWRDRNRVDRDGED